MAETMILEFHCQPGKGAEVAAMLRSTLPDTRAYEGAEVVELWLDASNPDVVSVFERWASRQHQEKYFAWRASTGGVAALAPLLAAPPKVIWFDVTSF